MALGIQLFSSVQFFKHWIVSLLLSEDSAVAQRRFVAPSRTSNTIYLFDLSMISACSTKMTSPKFEARMPETLALGGGAMEVLHTRHLVTRIFILLIDRIRKSKHGSPSSELSRRHVIMLDMKFVQFNTVFKSSQHLLVCWYHGMHFTTR